MAISSSYNFSVSRDDIIKGALRILGVIGEGDTPSTEQYSTGSEALNILCKAWVNEGLPLWLVKQFWIELDQGKSAYTINKINSTTSQGVDSTAGSYPVKILQGWFRNRTAVTTPWATNTAKVSGDNVYPSTDNGFYYSCTTAGTTDTSGTEPTWPTVAGNTVTDNTVTWTAASWEQSDVPMTPLSEQEYHTLGNKSSSGQPAQYSAKAGLGKIVVNVFPVPGSTEDGKRAYFLAHTPFSDFDTSADTPDFPQEFYRALKFGLANELSFEYGYPSKDRQDLERRAEMYKTQAFAFVQEEESFNFQIDVRRY